MARLFNGTNESAVAPFNLGLSAAPLTISVWFKPLDLTRNQTIVSLANPTSDDGQYIVFRGALVGDPLTASTNDSGVSFVEASTGTSGIIADRWYHACAVFYSSNSRAIFFNGTKFTNSGNASPSNFMEVSVGRFSTISTGHFSGELAEISLWNIALTDGEAISLSKGCSPFRVRPQNQLSMWRLIGKTSPEQNLKQTNPLFLSGSIQTAHPRIF